jgi:hypothetical protein
LKEKGRGMMKGNTHTHSCRLSMKERNFEKVGKGLIRRNAHTHLNNEQEGRKEGFD